MVMWLRVEGRSGSHGTERRSDGLSSALQRRGLCREIDQNYLLEMEACPFFEWGPA